VLVLLLLGYFVHSTGYISIINKSAKTDATSLIFQAQRDGRQRTEGGRQTTENGAKRVVIEPIRLPLSEDKKLIIYFDFDSTRLSSDAFEKLEQLAATLLKRPEIRIIIKGFTDGAGIYSYNKLLSEYRAKVVKSYLIGKKIEPSRIKTIGIGPAQPKAANTSAKLNRRVEIELHRKVLTETGGGK
jgi:outer membrane protein OmpA-like peptidoglycan-associated protein